MRNKLLYMILAVAIILSGMVLPANALLRGFSLDHFPSDKMFGIGAYFAPKEISIYAEPDLNSKILEKLQWAYARVQLNSASGNIEDPNDVFISFYPYKEIAVMAVVDDKEDWVNVVYDHKNKLTGWVYLKTPVQKTVDNDYIGNYYTWLEFMQKIATKQGIYFVPGVGKEAKKLRSNPEDSAKVIKHQFTHIRGLKLLLVKGNWMLIKVYDFEETSPIGWIKWRDDDGQLKVYCNLD